MAAPKKRPVELHSEYFDDDCASEGMGESEDGDPVEDTNLHWIGHLVIWKMEISEIGKVICFFSPVNPFPLNQLSGTWSQFPTWSGHCGGIVWLVRFQLLNIIQL